MFKETSMQANSTESSNAKVANGQREGEIVEGLRALSAAIDSMESAAVAIVSRLHPVLRPAEPANHADELRSDLHTPFAQELGRLQDRIWSITRLVDNANGRMELP